MELEITPPVAEELLEALAEALETARSKAQPVVTAWQRAALAEGIERGDYAFPPRSTRGATRA